MDLLVVKSFLLLWLLLYLWHSCKVILRGCVNRWSIVWPYSGSLWLLVIERWCLYCRRHW